ncbi:hypothetical protein DB346_13250 [Verrucomicrobia bacterium LW23]|nr:hypothetical protein DB346_13250 [Verrucomicrobia bacterium LW23]
MVRLADESFFRRAIIAKAGASLRLREKFFEESVPKLGGPMLDSKPGDLDKTAAAGNAWQR